MVPPFLSERVGRTTARACALVVSATLLALAVGSCRLDPLAPRGTPALASDPAGAGGALPSPRWDDVATPAPVGNEAVVPEITWIRVEVGRETLLIQGMLRPRDPSYQPFYGPATPGGWLLQVMLNTGPDAPGYWRGYDYIVRGGEWSLEARTLVVRHITLDGDTPGGWGPACGLAYFDPRPLRFEIAVPRAAIGAFGRSLDFCLETYATVPCPVCAGGVSAEYVDDYFVSVPDLDSRAVVVVPTRRPALLSAAGLRAGRAGTDAVPRLALEETGRR
jgi:hypothetical protein